jgi:hypothetical protein
MAITIAVLVLVWLLILLAVAVHWHDVRPGAAGARGRTTDMSELIMYFTPKGARTSLRADNGYLSYGQSLVYQGREDAQVFSFPDELGVMGAQLNVEADGYTPFQARGVLAVDADRASWEIDDIHLQPASVAPPQPQPEPPAGPDWTNPLAVIQWVYETQHHNLATKTGCGMFTEACCEALHEHNSPMWGHIRKNPGQNQWNEHAVDAIQLLTPSHQTPPGIYDIIVDSVSTNASPAFNYVEPPKGELWYYPPAPLSAAAIKSAPAKKRA